jgi:hypothetical protein
MMSGDHEIHYKLNSCSRHILLGCSLIDMSKNGLKIRVLVIFEIPYHFFEAWKAEK